MVVINLKAMKIKNIAKFKGENIYNPPHLDFFINQRSFVGDGMKVNLRKFDYQNKIKCKLCGIDYSQKKLKYSLTTKMILETDKMLNHVQFDKIKFNVIDRPDLKHNDYSMIYLPYRVCEDCYLLFETLNDIKNYQIEIANLFRNPVDKVNFAFGYYAKIKNDENKVKLTLEEKNKIKKLYKEIDSLNKDEDDSENDYMAHPKTNSSNNTEDNANNELNEENSPDKKPKNLYRILIMFNDIIWNDKIKIPNKELFLVYSFLGNYYKIPIILESYCSQLDYSLINFYKLQNYINCRETYR